MKVKHAIALLATPAALAAANPAQAADFYEFKMTGGVTGEFRITMADLADPAETAATYFIVEDIAGVIAGNAIRMPSVTFNTAAWDGGLTAELPDGQFLGLFGEQLFTGSTLSPTFRTGAFSLVTETTGLRVNLSIAAVPEPATWAMMILGFGVVGAALRRNGAVRARVRFA